MNDDPAAAIDIAEEHGSFLLIRAGSRFAVVEKRAGQVYPMLPGGREGEPTTVEGVAKVMAEEGWLPEPEARRLFKELSAGTAQNYNFSESFAADPLQMQRRFTASSI